MAASFSLSSSIEALSTSTFNPKFANITPSFHSIKPNNCPLGLGSHKINFNFTATAGPRVFALPPQLPSDQGGDEDHGHDHDMGNDNGFGVLQSESLSNLQVLPTIGYSFSFSKESFFILPIFLVAGGVQLFPPPPSF